MARQKLLRFAQNQAAPNVIQEGKSIYTHIRGKWNELHFPQNQPIILELGCGRGEYTTGLAPHFPQKNFIGVDIKGSRIWKGSQIALEQGLTNVAFLRAQISNLDFFFAEGEVCEIWITFPDPRPKGDDEHRRLTSPRFLNLYKKLLSGEQKIHFKTDNEALFDYTLEVLQNYRIKNLQITKDLYHSDLNEGHFGIRTTYEHIFAKQGFKINYLQFQFEDTI